MLLVKPVQFFIQFLLYYNFLNNNMGIYQFTCHTWTNTYFFHLTSDFFKCINSFSVCIQEELVIFLFFFSLLRFLYKFYFLILHSIFHLMGRMFFLSNLNHLHCGVFYFIAFIIYFHMQYIKWFTCQTWTNTFVSSKI